MKRPLLFVLLGLSLAGNALLAYRLTQAPGRRTAPAAATTTAAHTVGSTSSENSASATASADSKKTVPMTWPHIQSDDDLRQLVTSLRAAGCPVGTLRSIINSILMERLTLRNDAKQLPYWKASMQWANQAAEYMKMETERRALFESLLGDDARPSATMSAAIRARNYGNLSDTKIDALVKIERDYQEMQMQSSASSVGAANPDYQSKQRARQLLDAEKEKDLTSLLTPEEYTQYQMRRSQTAMNLIGSLRTVDVSESEYASLYQAQRAYEAANQPTNGPISSETMQQRQTSRSTLNDQMRAVLGDDRFYQYLNASNNTYQQITRALPAIPQSTAYQVFQLHTEVQSLLSAARTAETQTKLADYNARLDALLGSEAAATYRKQGSGRIFNANTNQQPTVQLGN